MVRRAVRLIATLVLSAIVVAGVAWGAMALWFDGPQSRVLAGTMAAGLVLVSILVGCIRSAFLERTRGCAVARRCCRSLVDVDSAKQYCATGRPMSLARRARLLTGSRVTIENVRNFKYRSESDYDQRWETRTYNLDRIRGVDLFLSFWGPTQIAHTIASWEFDDGQHLAISIETRKEKGESYSALRGFFRQYELYYVVADERDLVGLRTNHRGEQVYLYRIRVPASQARALLVDYLDEVNRLADHPQWYNALTQNCTTTIRGHAQNVGAGGRLDWRSARQRPPRSNFSTNAVRSTPTCPSRIFEPAATSPEKQRPPTTLPIFPPASAKGCRKHRLPIARAWSRAVMLAPRWDLNPLLEGSATRISEFQIETQLKTAIDNEAGKTHTR